MLTDHELRTAYFQAGAAGFVPKGDAQALAESLDQIRRELAIRDLSNREFSRIDWEVKVEDADLVIALCLVQEDPTS